MTYLFEVVFIYVSDIQSYVCSLLFAPSSSSIAIGVIISKSSVFIVSSIVLNKLFFPFLAYLLLSHTKPEPLLLKGKIQSFPMPSLWPHGCSLYILHHHLMSKICPLPLHFHAFFQCNYFTWTWHLFRSYVLQLVSNDRVISTCLSLNIYFYYTRQISLRPLPSPTTWLYSKFLIIYLPGQI